MAMHYNSFLINAHQPFFLAVNPRQAMIVTERVTVEDGTVAATEW